MKAVRINYDLKYELQNYTDTKMNYDAIVNRLIHDVSDVMPVIESDSEKVNINLHKDTMDKLKAYALTTGESYENILIRMFLVAKDLNKMD